MLKGRILKNLFKLENAKCASFETAEKLVRLWMPKGTYRDDNCMVVPVDGCGDIELAIVKEKDEKNGGFLYRIRLSNIFPTGWDE